MTIKDIAKLANVSPATVSKIMNGKHENISIATTERVMKIVKEYNYAPYAKTLAAQSGKTLLIGILLRGRNKHPRFLEGILQTAREEGYGTIVCMSCTPEEEQKNIMLLLAHRVDGVLWERVASNGEAEKRFAERQTPFYTIDFNLPASSKNLCMNYWQAGFRVTQNLVEAKHQKIVCIVPKEEGNAAHAFRSGYKQCLYEHNIPINDQLTVTWDGKSPLDQLLLCNTGFVCYHTAIALELFRIANQKNYRIPRDFSVVALDHEEDSQCHRSDLSAIPVPYRAFGEHCCRMLIGTMEKKKTERAFPTAFTVNHGRSIDVPITVRNRRIVVVGALNTDTLVNVSSFPTVGETITAKSYAIMPGGKGVNQAIGASKLGAEVCLIGKRGRDYQGDILLDALLKHNIDASAVKVDDDCATGHAYIYVQENGESSIVIYEGANRNLTPKDIEDVADSFRNASFCLLQTELQSDTVECAARIAKAHGAKVLLKPAAITEISDSLLRNVDIFQPNQNELDRLCTDDLPLEEKAGTFLERGVKAVIVTLASKGCYFCDGEQSGYFPAADFQPVDTTGAADAFSAALAVSLAEGRSMATAIRYANCAAGFSITRQGVPPSLVDKSTLELYLSGLADHSSI